MLIQTTSVAWLLVGALGTGARAGFLDLTGNDFGGNTLTGSLDGVSVFARAGDAGGQYGFVRPDGVPYNGTSPQYGYAAVYDPATPATDEVVYEAFSLPGGGIGVTIAFTFGAPLTDLRFHVANLDNVKYTFALTNGLTGVSLVRGNGGGGDGLQVVGNVVSDADPATTNDNVSGNGPSVPPLTGPRSAYGTVALDGTYRTLTVDAEISGPSFDRGSFTLSSVPEPTAAALGVAGVALLRRRR